jgi:glutamate 5-kinase
MKLVVKVGTQAILDARGNLRAGVMDSLVLQVARLQKAGHRVVLVSSGAVASGRKVAREVLNREYGSELGEKQVLAALGQHALMQAWARLLAPHGLGAAQLLLTKQDFQTRAHYLNISRVLSEATASGRIIPVINENDTVAVEELMFTDNDELSGLIAAQVSADALVILTSVPGVFDGPPDDPASRIIPVIDGRKGWPRAAATKTAQGRGGMTSKLGTAKRMSLLGIKTFIAAVDEKDVLLKVAKGENPGTLILPATKKSGLKKWIAFGTGKKGGTVTVNTCLRDILVANDRAVSLLPVGITKISGAFEKGDLVDILGPSGRKLGIGIARYGAAKLKEHMGEKGRPEFIHYDHLHIDGEE